ncbi:Fic family protein [Prevotella communis]|uniref:Fic family protein n=1 Tax=Prevotella communis TaxID=2913614 RepID=UPI001EDAFC72|nr:Fic family protein [Prevotella communis]UKK66588.1 Fic family protein [Prevotella communis]UKK71272.1 Fic family protein [Prevotella communis]
MSEKKKELYLDFDEYIRQGEPSQKEKASIWQTAIGLQAVDGLKVSDYLKETAQKHIEGEIGIDEVRELIKTYYQSKTRREPDDDEKQEADKVSSNITKILSSDTLDFSANGYIALHRRIFEGVFKHAGELRQYDITKKEWVLEGDTVHYLNWEDLRRALDYDIAEERSFSYKGLSQDQLISHLTRFVSGLWQIHAFGEGNTRTTAVFTILYLRHIGFKVTNDMFAQHSWYFRNALVRANYKSAVLGIDYSPIYLERFFRNLLLGDGWDLRNRYLHIHPTEEWKVQLNRAVTNGDTCQSDKYPTSTRQVPDKLDAVNPNIIKLVQIIGEQEMTVKDLMTSISLKDRENFLNLYLNPAISEGYVRLLYPQSPRHPRQKYLLTAKGLEVLKGV